MSQQLQEPCLCPRLHVHLQVVHGCSAVGAQAWLAAQKEGGTGIPTAIRVFTSQAANLAQPTPVA